MDDVEDDSLVGSDIERYFNIFFDNFEFEFNDGNILSEGMDNELFFDIFNYIMVVELLLYYDELLLFYEEVLVEDERRERRFYFLIRFRDVFLW